MGKVFPHFFFSESLSQMEEHRDRYMFFHETVPCAITLKNDYPPCAAKCGEVLLYSLYFIDISLLFRDLYVSLRLCLLDTSARQNK